MKAAMTLDRETKRTYRYQAVDPDPVIVTLYVQKKHMPNPAPQTIEVTVEPQ